MGNKWTALISIAAIFLVFVPLSAEAGRLPNQTGIIKFSDASYGDGATAVVFVTDPELNSPSQCSATWSEIPSAVIPFAWWSLATGSPHEDQYALSQACLFDTESPSLTPLRLTAPIWTARLDGVEVLLANIDPALGRFALGSAVNASSTVDALFDFDVVNSYTATSTLARIHSESDPEGEPLPLTEVSGESDPTPSPASKLFRGHILVSSDPASQSPNDGSVWVRSGDTLFVDYFGLEKNGTPVSSASADTELAPPKPTPTPVPAASSVSLVVLGAAFVALTLWQLRRVRRPIVQ